MEMELFLKVQPGKLQTSSYLSECCVITEIAFAVRWQSPVLTLQYRNVRGIVLVGAETMKDKISLPQTLGFSF